MKAKAPSSTRKKVVVCLFDDSALKGYINPDTLGSGEALDLLTSDGEHVSVPLGDTKAVYFVADFAGDYRPDRKAFLSRPKLKGLWLRLIFRDQDTLEGIVTNDLAEILDRGIQLTPPDLHGNCLRIFVPRPALREATVLGVVGADKRSAKAAAAATTSSPSQPGLFNE